MGDCFVKKYRAGFASNESNALLEKYLLAFTDVLGKVLGTSIGDLETAGDYMKDHGALPLGFGEWFRKYGADMSLQLSRAEFREEASDKFLDELDYYLMILKADMGEIDNESRCSDLVASLTRLSKMLISESCLVWQDGFLMKADGRGIKYEEKVSIDCGGGFFWRKAA